MILVGMKSKDGNLAMPTMYYNTVDCVRLKEAVDIHDAANIVWRCFHPFHPCAVSKYVKAEMHDTKSGKTWTVDRNGHTLRDYHSESEKDFRSRFKTV